MLLLPIRDRRYGRPQGELCRRHCYRHLGARRSYFGDQFVDHYVATREWETQEYQRQVTDWQLKRYFEII